MIAPTAGWWPLVGLLIAAGVIVLAVEYWPERRTPDQRWLDDMARASRRYERSTR